MVQAHKREHLRGMGQRAACFIRMAALIAAMCLAVCANALATTSDDPLEAQRLLSVTLTVKPQEMVASGDATMTFVISNPSEFDIQNVYLASADGALSEPIGQIDAGETQTFVRTHNVTEAELDAGQVSYTVTHDPLIDGNDKITYDLIAPVVRVEALPQVDFTRQISSDYVVRGGVAVITYKVRNTGNVAISGVRVRDSLGDFTGRAELMNIGETRTFISRVTVSEDAVSQPTLEYTVPDGETVSVQMDAADIHLSEGGLEAHFSVGESAFSENTADAILTLNNNGNTDYTDISVVDDVYGGVIADSIDLPAGSDPVEIAYTYPVRGDCSYRWRITGVNKAGERVDFLTRTYELSGDSEVEDISVAISAVPSMTEINRPGYVNFAFEISNTGTDMAQDVLLYEVNLGQVRKLAVLPVGEPTRCSANYEVTADSQFIFCLNYTDENGHPRTVSTAPININITPGGETPIQVREDSLDLEGGSVKMKNSFTLLILLGAIGALLLILFVVLVITSTRVRRERKARREAEKQRMKEEMGKTNPFKPIKAGGKTKK